MTSIDWTLILGTAAEVVDQYDTRVTLRQLFYRLVAAELLPNTQSAYKRLSARTAKARREGSFPALEDRTRSIHRTLAFETPAEALDVISCNYRRDRTEGQEWNVYLGVEKHGLVNQLTHWFDLYGLPMLALGGYSSQTLVDEVRHDVHADGRPAVLLYAGDFDPSGIDIDRDFVERTDCFDQAIRVALTADQVDRYNLPPQMGKATDSRSGAFIREHGRLVQVELDALPPDTLQQVYATALDPFWDTSTYNETLQIEEEERQALTELAHEWLT